LRGRSGTRAEAEAKQPERNEQAKSKPHHDFARTPLQPGFPTLCSVISGFMPEPTIKSGIGVRPNCSSHLLNEYSFSMMCAFSHGLSFGERFFPYASD